MACRLQHGDGLPVEHQVLLHAGRLLDDATLLASCGLCAGSTVHQTSRLRGGKPVKARAALAVGMQSGFGMQDF